MKKPVVNQDTCIGCGTCVAMAPKTFKMESDGKSHVVESPQDDEDTIQATIDACPVDAISWEE